MIHAFFNNFKNSLFRSLPYLNCKVSNLPLQFV